MYLSSDRANAGATVGGADFDIYASTRTGPGAPWGWPAPVAGIASNDDEYDPFVAQGGLVVFFTSMRSGMGDIYWSSRRSLAEPFAAPLACRRSQLERVRLGLPRCHPTSARSMFSSTRSGNAEIYEATALR